MEVQIRILIVPIAYILVVFAVFVYCQKEQWFFKQKEEGNNRLQ